MAIASAELVGSADLAEHEPAVVEGELLAATQVPTELLAPTVP